MFPRNKKCLAIFNSSLNNDSSDEDDYELETDPLEVD
jgi:hypothetical protein